MLKTQTARPPYRGTTLRRPSHPDLPLTTTFPPLLSPTPPLPPPSADKLLDDPNYRWSPEIKAKIGAFLIAKLIENCVAEDGRGAFVYEKFRKVSFEKETPN